MNKENILKYLVPVVAVIVLAESVMLIANLNKGKVTNNQPVGQVVTSEQPTVADSVYQIDLTADSQTVKVNKTGKVTVAMRGNTDRAIDSISVYVKFDPEMVEISGLTFDKKLPVPAFSKISTTKNLVVANFLISESDGLKLKANDNVTLMTFQIKPKKEGNVDFEISTGSEAKESATMIVENGTSKALPYSSNKLTVNAIL